MSAKGLSGKRVDASRAGTSTVKLHGTARWHRAVQRQGFALQHHGDAVADRKGQPVCRAGEVHRALFGITPHLQRALADGAYQQVDQAVV